MKKVKQNNIVKFPNTISDVEKEIEAVLFASSEPLTAESILEKITKKNTNVLKFSLPSYFIITTSGSW